MKKLLVVGAASLIGLTACGDTHAMILNQQERKLDDIVENGSKVK
jgi:hypothetical protein